MNLNFDTATLTQTEARAVIAYLSTLFAIPGQTQPTNLTPAPRSEAEAIAGVPISPNPYLQLVINDAAPASEAPTTTEAPAKRGRRTKAEIAADEAQQKAAALLPAGTLGVPSNVLGAEAPVPTPASPISPDELRTLLNAYIARHSMEDAIAVLQSFGCNRVTEALALDPAKLAELASQLNG